MDKYFEMIDESELETSELIEINKELLRIVEKEIDDAVSSKHGVTPWSIIAAMGAGAAVFFGIGKELLGLDW